MTANDNDPVNCKPFLRQVNGNIQSICREQGKNVNMGNSNLQQLTKEEKYMKEIY